MVELNFAHGLAITGEPHPPPTSPLHLQKETKEGAGPTRCRFAPEVTSTSVPLFFLVHASPDPWVGLKSPPTPPPPVLNPFAPPPKNNPPHA